jgi:predicted transcriptional regulator
MMSICRFSGKGSDYSSVPDHNPQGEILSRSVTELREEMGAVARGERQAPLPPAVTTLHSVLTPDVSEMLKDLPATVSWLAQRRGKTPSQASRTLQRLAMFGRVRLMRVGSEVRA